MNTYEFIVVALGADPHSTEFENQFLVAGCDDATVSFQRGFTLLDFARQSSSAMSAISSAIEQASRAGVEVVRLEPDYLVSLSEIAKRSNLSRSAVSLYFKGERASGFPSPVARITADSPLWDWAEVGEWMRAHRTAVSREDVEIAKAIRHHTMMLEARRLPTIDTDQPILTNTQIETLTLYGARGITFAKARSYSAPVVGAEIRVRGLPPPTRGRKIG